ncbi:hypothetical protein EYR40_007921 [Pleurotus pulmonarius]|nr:hypothetical protein EYR36_008788 [Pleurotus pulmonarius]KAF4596390.1 hypothetical protein EYR38_007770 [Pleurotus pulmonarius]KAF4597462.1 hypothetical protein EYR40_007921 [Pleurotus pulmonarius]
MRIGQYLIGACSLLAFHTVLASSPIGEETETVPELSVVGSFAESNPFGHVVNGEKNQLSIAVENKTPRVVTVVSVAGSVHHPETDKLIKNLTSVKYDVQVPQGLKINLPYNFHSEFKPGDLRLRVWLDHLSDDEKLRTIAYDSIVAIVEPEGSIFDLKLLITYLIVAAFCGGLGYFAYLSFVPQTKKPRGKASVQSVSAPTGTVTASGAGGYQEEWIPEHHLKRTKAGKKDGGVTTGTSGDELSGGEVSGTEGRKRKTKK